MTKLKIKDGVEVSESGTKKDIKITPKYPRESIRKLDNLDGEKGDENKPHYHAKPSKSFWKRIFSKEE